MRPNMIHAAAWISGTVLLASTAPVRADWQFTQWGMTSEQVVKASKGVARATSPDEMESKAPINSSERVLLTIPVYQAGDLPLAVDFYFDTSGKLSRVALTLKSPDKIYEMENALINKYGQPTIPDGDGGVWLTARDHIVLSREFHVLQYAPRATTSSGAL